MDAYQKLSWDSKIFGYDVARINVKNLSTEQLDNFLTEFKKQNIKLVYWSVAPKDDPSNKAAVENNGYLADAKITYLRKSLPEDNRLPKSEFIHSYLNSKLNNKLLSLALQSGQYSRFKLDPYFKNHEFEKLYKLWIENSLNGKIAKEILVYKDGEKELGLITIGIKDKKGDIGLLAVDEEMRGKSIGKSLMNAAFKSYRKLGFNEIQVVTQKANLAACKFYEKLGFKSEKEENIYHFWL